MYASQHITLKQYQSTDTYNQAIYTSLTIRARFEYKRKQVRDKNGQKVMTEAQCYTATRITTDDVVTYDGRDWPVVFVKDIVNLDGIVAFYEVSL
jgi:hypothetical protein